MGKYEKNTGKNFNLITHTPFHVYPVYILLSLAICGSPFTLEKADVNPFLRGKGQKKRGVGVLEISN